MLFVSYLPSYYIFRKGVREVNGNTSKLSKIHFPIVWRQVFNGFPSPNAHCFEFKLLFLCCQPAALISIVLSSCEFLELCSLHFLTHTSLRDCFFFFPTKKIFPHADPADALPFLLSLFVYCLLPSPSCLIWPRFQRFLFPSLLIKIFRVS